MMLCVVLGELTVALVLMKLHVKRTVTDRDDESLVGLLLSDLLYLAPYRRTAALSCKSVYCQWRI